MITLTCFYPNELPLIVSQAISIWVVRLSPGGVMERHHRTEQNRTEQNRTEQNRTEQNRTEQNRTEQNRTEQSERE